jgi:Protein of unknown function (DUF2924)
MGRRSYLTLARMVEMPPEEIRAEWARRYDAPAPNVSLDLLRMGLAYKLQQQRAGGLSRSTRALLRRAALPKVEGEGRAPLPRKLTPGTRLVRDWHSVGHTVTVLERGFEYDGRHWKSLSAIAREITGTQWNGPKFFGLAERRA